MTGNGRIVENNCSKQQFDLFVRRLLVNTELSLKSHKPATDTILQDRYTFSCEYERISIVYELNSQTLVITAADHLLRLLKTELSSLVFSRSTETGASQPSAHTLKDSMEKKSGKLNNPAAGQATELNSQPRKQNNQSIGLIEKQNNDANKQNARLSIQATKKESVPQLFKNQSVNEQTKNPKSAKEQIKLASLKNETEQMREAPQSISSHKHPNENQIKQQKSAKQTVKQSAKEQARELATKRQAEEKAKAEAAKLLAVEEASRLEELYKNGFSIKKYPPERLEDVLKNLKALKGVMVRQLPNADGSRSYRIADDKSKVYLRFIESKKTLQLQGKRSKLFGEVQVLVSQDSDYLTAVSSHIDLTGEEKRARDMERRLKKLLPNAFDFLSEQSRIDLTIGMIDIGNDEVKLSDYSMLLVPPYRGLERLIFDLQRLKNIEVKMIGQAYEKTDAGEYVLKLGYRRKINSVVYAEVMSALYTEYFARRNFYAHSDITGDLLSRVITEKAAVREIFDRLIEVVEYNIRKLKEIDLKPQS